MDPESTYNGAPPLPPISSSSNDGGSIDDEPVDMSDPNNPHVREFIDSVKRLCNLDDSLKQSATAQRGLASEKNALRTQVTDFMVNNGIDKVNYGKNEHLVVETRVSSGSLTRKTLVQALRAYFEIEDVEVTAAGAADLDTDTRRRLQEAEELLRYIDETLGHKSRTLLLREKRDKKRRAPKPPKPMSVYLDDGAAAVND